MNKAIPAFWDILPTFFLIPLKGVGIVALLLFSAIVTNFPSLFVYIIIFFAAVKYGMEILHNTAEGVLKAPELSFKVLNENYDLPFKLLALFLLPLYLLSKVGDSAPIISIFLVVFYSIVLPASIMTLAYTRHLISALNPIELVRLITRLAWSYVTLYILLFFLSSAPSIAYFFFAEGIGSSVFLAVLFQIYFYWVMYAMMGYVLYQYHDDIGYELASEREDRKKKKLDPLSGIDASLQSEDYMVAQRDLKALILTNPTDLELRRKFHKLAKISGDTKELTQQGAGMIWRLIGAGKNVEAANIYLDCVKADSNFKPVKDSDYLPLATELKRMRLYKKAISLCNDFHVNYPNSIDLPFLYLLVIKILIEDLSQDEMAKPILSFLEKNYIGHEIADDLAGYNSYLSRV
ncbi:MAG: hypothetical protein PSN44_03150 [Gammaproteobacteria bacterium]|nr:hypothetical protein [Gammaproteobacteria bacterium]